MEGAGLVVDKIESEYRSTRLGEKTADGKGGLEGWVRLMCASSFELVEKGGKRDAAVKTVCDLLESVIKREEDRSMWIGYVRLRGVARKR